ncbi:uncharacterized protein [Littorina saxatilis]|uniref:Uncharacterized protein n=1 Tax=Littorina saxatilis TaxID=31220 RepID=A0AAN9B7Z1_9CAEN
MGGSSSKERKAKSQSTSKYNKKAKVKGKSGKGKVRKGSVQWSRSDGEGGDITFISGGRRTSNNDVEDLTSPPQRGRSKSLRFGDFTQLDRMQRVDTTDLLPVDIAFFQDGKVEPEELCHVCGVFTGCEVLLCGVCYRAYHQGCLAKIGQWSGAPDLLTTAGMWSCHQCSTLGSLLNDQEVTVVLKRLEKCGIRKEDDITLRDYLAFCHVSLQEDEDKVLTRDKAENAKRRFAQVDTDGHGRLTWCQFLNIEAVRILKKRNKNALVRLLTKPELERARDAFRILDTDMDGRITKATAHDALDRNSRRSGYYPDETMMYIDEDLDQSISWMEFLQDRAIYIIAERPCLQASPLGYSTTRRGSNRSSLAVASSLPVTPITKTPPLPRGLGKGVAKDAARPAAASVPNTPRGKHEAGGAFRHSDGAAQGFKAFPGNIHVSAAYGSEQGSAQHHHNSNKPGPTSPAKRQSAGFPLLPPPPPSSRAGSSHHAHRGSSSVPSTPVKKSAPEFQPHQSGLVSSASPAYSDQPTHRGSNHSTGSSGSRLSGGSDTRTSSGYSDQQSGIPGNPFRRESSGSTRRFAQGESGTAPGNGISHVTSKPPMGSGPGRAVAAPPYGKLVERVQKGEYRQGQARSMYLVSDSACAQITPSFGHVTTDSSTGRRPLSLV